MTGLYEWQNVEGSSNCRAHIVLDYQGRKVEAVLVLLEISRVLIPITAPLQYCHSQLTNVRTYLKLYYLCCPAHKAAVEGRQQRGRRSLRILPEIDNASAK
jgi:hypothetical protein